VIKCGGMYCRLINKALDSKTFQMGIDIIARDFEG
jgi:hypothetical protein